MRQHRVTSFDVAARAGVSQSTVSRALTGDPVVSEATRTRVMDAARELNYHVDENAARLRTGKTGTLAVVVICRPGELRKDVNPFYYSLLGSICAAASACDYETLVSFQDTAESLWGLYEEQRKADGLIIIGSTANRHAWDYFRGLHDAGAHLICWGSPFDDFDWIRSDNHCGARLAANHLLERGYRKVVYLGSEHSPQRQFKERWEGFAERLREDGIEPRLIEIDETLSREEQGRKGIKALAEAGWPCDAIFAACDEIALGALEELRHLGKRVPDEIGLIGFDGNRGGAHSSPPLTSIEPDFESAGSMLVNKLLALIAGEDSDQRRVSVRLLERESTRRS